MDDIDEIVRMCEAASRDDRLADVMLYRKAAAALVAMKAAKEKAEAERDSLKRHAEAMHAW